MRNLAIFYGTRLRVFFFAFLLLVCVSAPARVSAQISPTLSTNYFTIFYPQGEEKAAAWYAGFVDEVDSAVSDMLGSQPLAGLKLRLYATEAEYTAANPLAEAHPGIMAHAVPELREVGVAVERLRQMPPELARESFRHEMTHVVAGALSNNKLPVGLQEGLAQYNELSATRGQEVATLLRAAQAKGAKFLTWGQLNDGPTFARSIDLAYPQSYSVMAFLAEKYGMAAYGRLLKGLRSKAGLQSAFTAAYGLPMEKLEAEWLDYLPVFLTYGWQLNLFQAYDLGPAQALYNAGQYKAAQEAFARSERLYRDLGKESKADEIAAMKQKAAQAQGATDLNAAARKALEAHDYAQAQEAAGKGGAAYTNLKLPGTQPASTAELAARGLAGVELLASARKRMDSWDLAASEQQARQAGAILATLGDDARVADANSILYTVWLWRRLVGFAALAVGSLAVLLGSRALLRARGRNRIGVPLPRAEEDRSWL